MARTKQAARQRHLARTQHICGLYLVDRARPEYESQRLYMPQLSLSVKSKIVSSASRTTLTQTFVNPKSEPISELRYTFPLYDGVSVVGFVCTINGDRVIRGVIKERAEAKETFKEAVDRGETAGLLEQLFEASDVFTTTVGNVPANAKLQVDITYLGELKHDAEVDGIRFTIPTHVAPRYGSYPGELLQSTAVDTNSGISIVVDIDMPNGCNVKNVQSPSHPISVTLGNTSNDATSGAEMSLQKASATLALSTTELDNDFVLQVVATNISNPVAVMETHPTIPNHRALMVTLVPKFNLPSSRPEIVFLCDRSGSMQGSKVENLKTALHLFLKSLPVGVKFNICSFGSRYEFLFPNGSRTYDESALEEATRYVDMFSANFGGTDIYSPMEAVFKKRYTDIDLEVFLLTDGEVWNQAALFNLLNKQVAETNGRARVFSLGIGRDVSHALIEGVAAAGNGFAQSVGDNENMNSKVVRMLKASLTPHITDYTLEIKYSKEPAVDSDDDFELVEKVMDGLAIDVQEPEKEEPPKKVISLFDESADLYAAMTNAPTNTSAGGKYSHVPPVSEPKMLQAPFVIPPLYPFNRTSVYLLLSPKTIQKQPKAVVLRGSSPYGPVELEIPVTVLPEKSETIHRLAARNAVKELEEGRGWIYHVSDAKDAAGPLLKDKYPGRFGDMVEREAVRLGVSYQVGGKWCSFVAVEADNDELETQEIQPGASLSAAAKAERERNMTFGGRASRRLASYKVCLKSVPSGAPAVVILGQSNDSDISEEWSAPVQQTMSHSGGLLSNISRGNMSMGSAAAPSPGTSSEVRFNQAASHSGGLLGNVGGARRTLFGSAAPHFNPAVGASPSQAGPLFSQTTSRNAGFFGSVSGGGGGASLFASAAPPPPPPAPAASLFGSSPYGGVTSPQCSLRRSRAEAPCPPAKAAKRAMDKEEETDLPGSQHDMQLEGLIGAEKLKALVSLQSFSGAWRWSREVLAILGLGAGFTAPVRLGGECDKLATALVLACLEGELDVLRDEWEMIAEKAREWLRGALEDGEALKGYCGETKALLRNLGHYGAR
ncbi:VIT-domain-containing protein [Parathielavia appendiculata]|uniref:VIT-domain-containing protein n=1 Tax=Parathielavia appendiculata TaxID=2587402 RepID=A0AAN6U6P7_9PEZI|nr:VIT-domain-containing protein [Parathielavia appendiculata]